MRHLLWLIAALGGASAWAQDAPACQPDPLDGRALYLRGSFNAWAAPEPQRFTWVCNRWQLVTTIAAGEHRFKAADEGWSADADFGAGPGSTLLRRGPELQRRLGGVQRFTITMNRGTPELQIEDCPAPPPLGETQLFLRGSMNNWAALDDYAFQYSCDAYYLNVRLSGRHEFKVADAQWQARTSFGQGTGNFEQQFEGTEQTLRLVLDGGPPRLAVGPRSFADPRPAQVTDAIALSLRFDSRSLLHKRPFGAVPAGTAIEFAVSALPGVEQLTLVVEKRRLEGNQELLEYSEVVRAPLQKSAGESGRELWQTRLRFDAVSVYGYWFEARIAGRLYALQNNADAIFWTREKGSNGNAVVSELPASPRTLRRLRQTVFAPDFKLPDWAPDIVYYYLFPDRFRNGDKRNDPHPGRQRYQGQPVEAHARWNERPFRPGSGDGSDAIHNNDFFGGDLAGVIEKLDDIRELGANTIYMTPVFKAGSNHKYDTADYRQIDPGFGSNADFVRLTREAARRGMRVILDTSLNHVGSDSLYFNRFGTQPGLGAFQNGRIEPRSPYASWFHFDKSQSDPNRQYKGWVGVPDLPEIDKASPAFRRFAFGAKDSVMKQWLDRGAAGWRMDVAPWVPDDFWREWRAAVKAHKPDALTIAEAWFDASKYFLGDMFDTSMNYVFRNAVLGYAGGGDARELYKPIELMREAYPPQTFYAQMNLLSSHDQARALHVLGGIDGDAAALAQAKQRLKLAVFFQMSFPGAPTVYYGDEVGLGGGEDPDNRRPYPWADEGGEPDLALRAEFRKLIALRRQHAVLRRGSIDAPLFIDAQVVVLARRLGERWAITATNNGPAPRWVNLPRPEGLAPGLMSDALGGAAVEVTASGLRFEVPALYGRVLVTP
jgi:glycosidase